MHASILVAIDTLAEWLRRWTRNPLGSARRGSNPLGVDLCTRTYGETKMNRHTHEAHVHSHMSGHEDSYMVYTHTHTS